MAMREAAGTLIADWRERGRNLGFGAGITQGYATLGQIGFSERSCYTGATYRFRPETAMLASSGSP